LQYAMTVILILSTSSALLGQRVHIVGNVTGHTFLGVAGAPRDVQVVGNETMGLINLRVRPADGVVVIPLIARSNTAYRLTVRGSEKVEVHVSAVKPLASAGHLMTGAANPVVSEPVPVTRSPRTILAGSRISNGGNDSTMDNGLLIELEVNAHEANADLTLSMEPTVTPSTRSR
jgi:hypothetical protein